MKKIKHIFISSITGLILLASCNNIFDSPPIENGYGKVQVIITSGDAARTTLPPENTTQFTSIVYTFTKDGESTGQEQEPVNGSFTLEPGDYTVKVEAYMGTGPSAVKAAEGTSEQFTVATGNPATVTVKLNGVYSGAGSFTYTITYPATADLTMTLTKWADDSDVDITATDTTTGDTKQRTKTLQNLDAGSYVFTVTVTDTATGNYAGFIEAVHIFPGMTTTYPDRTFGANDLILKKRDYIITFYKNDGTTDANPPTKTVEYPKKTKIDALPAEPTRTGYTFIEWNTEDDGSGTEFTVATEVTNLSADADFHIKVYAKWAKDRKVEFYENKAANESVYDTTYAIYPDYKAVMPTAADPTWDATHVFSGWYTVPENTGGEKVDADYTVNDDMSAYARWLAKGPNDFTFNFEANGGTPAPESPIIVPKDTKVTAPAAMTKTGYDFDAWYRTIDFSGSAWNFTTDEADQDNITLYAKWTIKSYTVTFNSNGGSAVPGSPFTQNYNTTITEPTAPTLTNYKFDGWYKEAGLINAWNFTSEKVVEDTTLFAKWTYKVTFDANSPTAGTAPTAITEKKGTDITIPGDNGLQKTGFNFGGWNTLANGSGTNYLENATYTYNEDATEGAVTLYAKWTAANINVTFDSVSANGSATETTTQLTLAFSAAINGLAAGDISFSGVNGVTANGTLTNTSGGTYTLGINGFTAGGTLTVTVANKSGYSISPSSNTVTIYYAAADTPITFSGVTANGSNTVTTTQLTLAFSAAINGLVAGDISFSGVNGVTANGTLTNTSGGTYTLGINGFTAGGTLTVTVANKTGYSITGSPQSTTIYYYAAPVDTPVTFSGVTANGNASQTTTQLTLTFSEAITGLVAGDISFSGVSGVTANGTLNNTTGGTYTLGINGFTTGGTLTVTVANKSGYNITGSPQSTTIYYYATGSAPITITWDEHANPNITGSPTIITTSGSVTLTASMTSAASYKWYKNGVDTNLTGSTYNFSSNELGTHTVNVVVTTTDSKVYSASIQITVQ